MPASMASITSSASALSTKRTCRPRLVSAGREQRQKWCRRIWPTSPCTPLDVANFLVIRNHGGGRGKAFPFAARQVELFEVARQVHLLVNAAGSPRLKPFSVFLQQMLGHRLLQLLDGSHAMRHVWRYHSEKRQQREAHGNDQQGHLDDAGRRLVVNSLCQATA